MSSLARELELEQKLEEHRLYNKLEYYDAYPFQQKFHNDQEPLVGLIAGNQMGKTVAGCMQDAYDLTGLYPDWYEGVKFNRPIKLICGGLNNEKTRDLLQSALLGNPIEKEVSLGTGWIPKHCLDKTKLSLKRGVTDAYSHAMVKHHTNGKFDGWSICSFSSYESGKEAWMGDTVDIYHGDEECPMEILSQMGRGCIARQDSRIRMTFTPEKGETDVLMKVKNEWSVHLANFSDVAGEDLEWTFDDGEILVLKAVRTLKGRLGHITKKTIESLAKITLPYVMKTRMLGLPAIGEGRVFAFMEEAITYDESQFPDGFPEYFEFIDSIDFGGFSTTAHPTAYCRLAYDPKKDIMYIYDGFKITGKEIPEVATMMRMKPNANIVPVIFPHDGNKAIGQGVTTANQYRSAGANMAQTHFTNPPEDHKIEGSGGIQIMAGITEMSARFNDGRLKIVRGLVPFFEEYGSYHLKDGKIVDRKDDFMSSLRLCVMSVRHAVTLIKKVIKLNVNVGSGGWMGS